MFDSPRLHLDFRPAPVQWGMGKQIELTCQQCGVMFNRDAGEVNRNKKAGRKVFCGLACACQYSNHNGKMGTKEHREQNSKRMKARWAQGINQNPINNLSPFKWFCGRSKQRKAKAYNITPEYLMKVWVRQKGLCVYSGMKLILPESTSGFSKRPIKYNRASLDRIDSKKGYIKGNVQFTCVQLNLAKSNLSHTEFVEFMKTIERR